MKWSGLLLAIVVGGLLLSGAGIAGLARHQSRLPRPLKSFRGIVVPASEVSATSIQSWKEGGMTIVLMLKGDDPEIENQAASLIESSGQPAEYFVEVGRNESMADTHPEWMSSLQGHDEWQRLFPDLARPKDGEIIKNYPWVPILYSEAFEAHLKRIQELLDGKPAASRIWLNDLQAGPSACGCGHILCRWTADYGPVRTARNLGDDAAARFVEAVRELGKGCNVVPVVTTECEEEDHDGECAGVDCFEGECWRAFSRQLNGLIESSPSIGVACFYKAFGRDLPRYGEEAAWVRVAVESLALIPPARGGKGLESNRVIALLQGWDVDEGSLQAQIHSVEKSGAAGYLIVVPEIPQSWEPRIFPATMAKPPKKRGDE